MTRQAAGGRQARSGAHQLPAMTVVTPAAADGESSGSHMHCASCVHQPPDERFPPHSRTAEGRLTRTKCEWMSTKPGVTSMPVASTSSAPVTARLGPTAEILPAQSGGVQAMTSWAMGPGWNCAQKCGAHRP